VRGVQVLVARPRSGSAREAARRNTAAGDILRIVETRVGGRLLFRSRLIQWLAGVVFLL